MLRHSKGLGPDCLGSGEITQLRNELEDRSTCGTNKCFEPQ